MAKTATMTWPDGDTFYFVSDDGERFYEVNTLPGSDADLEHLRPLGIVRTARYGAGSLHTMSFARRWLLNWGHEEGHSVEFGEVA